LFPNGGAKADMLVGPGWATEPDIGFIDLLHRWRPAVDALCLGGQSRRVELIVRCSAGGGVPRPKYISLRPRENTAPRQTPSR
jgi:hypothetical protein